MAPRLPRPIRSLSIGAAASAAALVPALLAAPAAQAGKLRIGTPGADRIVARSASGDTLYGGGGPDKLLGGRGPDRIYGVRSNNTILGRGGDDYIEGGAGSDEIDAGPGDNTVFGSSGHDEIRAGDGNNYVDAGGAPDDVRLGDGHNVLHTGPGGGRFRLGNGNNVVYYGSGVAYIDAGRGANTFYLSGTAALRRLDCGGNPQSVVYVNTRTMTRYSLQIFRREKARNCANIATFDGLPRLVAKQARGWQRFRLTGTDGRDRLLGGHGGGTITARGGDDEIWADYHEGTGGSRARSRTTRIDAGPGDNRIFGGRGTNVIRAGNGDNFIRAGAHVNRITVGSGANIIRLQGARSRNTVTIRGRPTGGRRTAISSFANGRKPVIRCRDGAKAIIVYGNTRPRTNCRPVYSARSRKGREAQARYTLPVPASEPVVAQPIAPGQDGRGVPRPATVGSP